MECNDRKLFLGEWAMNALSFLQGGYIRETQYTLSPLLARQGKAGTLGVICSHVRGGEAVGIIRRRFRGPEKAYKRLRGYGSLEAL